MDKEKTKCELGVGSNAEIRLCIECPYMSAYGNENDRETILVLAEEAFQHITYLKKKNEYLEYFLDRQNKDNESMLGPMAWDDIVWWIHNATEVDNVFTIEELKERFPKLLGHIETEEETAPAVKSENLPKPRAIYNGYNSHDCEAWYKCPVCDKAFSSWTIYHQKANENNTKNYCPKCKVELSGLD